MTIRNLAIAAAIAVALIVCPPTAGRTGPMPGAGWDAPGTPLVASSEVLIRGVESIIASESPDLAPHRRLLLATAIVNESIAAGLDPYLTTAVVMAESTFRTELVSHKGAVGLMQLLPSTAASMVLALPPTPRVSRLSDPSVNLRLGIAYLIRLRERFGDWQLALTAYHMGPERLAQRQRRNRKLPEGYGRTVLRNYLDYKGQTTQALAAPGYGSFRS